LEGGSGFGGGLSLEGGSGVEPVHGLFVGERIFFSVFGLGILFDGSDSSLDFVGVDDSGNISIGQNGSAQVIAFFSLSGVRISSENIV
jgi:hypothetical protein